MAGRAGRRASCSWSARTPRRTARTSATCGCSRRCCPSWPRSTASSGCGCPTSSRPRPGPGLVEAIATHARRRRRTSTCPSSTPAPTVLRRMRRFGDPESFLGLLEQIRGLAPEAGVRSNVIVGFPGETEDDLETLCDFLVAARLDVIGVFGYSDEDGTEAASYDGKLDEDEVRARVEHVTAAGRGAHRPAGRGADRRERRGAGRDASRTASVEGRAAHQGPEVDGSTLPAATPAAGRRPGPRGGRRHRGRRPGREALPSDRPLTDPRATRARPQQLERPQRADHAADRAGAVLRLGAAASTAATRSPGAASRSWSSSSR